MQVACETFVDPFGEYLLQRDNARERSVAELAFNGLDEREIFLISGIDAAEIDSGELEKLRRIIRKAHAIQKEKIARALIDRVKQGDVSAQIQYYRIMDQLREGAGEPERQYPPEEILAYVLSVLERIRA